MPRLRRYARSLVFDASGIQDSADLVKVYQFFHPVMRSIAPNGRVVVLTAVPEEADTPAAAACRSACSC